MSADKNPSVLFVCLGNIIRSPLCEGLLRSCVDRSVRIDSAAVTADDLDQHPMNHAQTVARQHGFDISSHISKLITDEDFARFDIIVALERYVYDCLKRSQPRGSKALICEFVPGKNIPNPWCGSLSDVQSMYVQIERGMKEFIRKYIPEHLRLKDI
jgi:protein-tyrosine phosphatase